MIKRVRIALQNLFRKAHNEEALDAEVRGYVEMLAEEKMSQGMKPEEARRTARIELGGVEQVKENVREVRAGAWLDSLLQDLRYGLRMLRKNPGFTAVALLTLALGIGANTAMFTLADAVFLRPLPYRSPEQLIWITEQAQTGDSTGVSWLNFQDWKRMNTVFSGMAGYRDIRMALAGESYPSLISGRYVAAGYFDLMGVSPFLGRTFAPGENVEGGPEVAILSYEFWQRQFGGSPQILGRTIRLDGGSFTIIGVMPKGFGAVSQTSVWAPFEQNVPKVYLTKREYAWLLYTVGRTKPGVSLQEARSDMDRVGRLLAQQYPGIDDQSQPFLKDLRRNMLGDNRAILLLLVTAVALLLVITCANLAGLLLVRMSSRQRELSVRRALGASKSKILQQVFTEGMLLAVAGGLLGIGAAWTAVHFAGAFLPESLPITGPVALNGRVLFFTFVAIVTSSFFFGFSPARFAMRVDPQTVLRSASYRIRGGHHRVHAGLIICQIGLAMAVLVGAGLLVRTMVVLLKTKVGFDTNQLLTATVLVGQMDNSGRPESLQLAEQGIERIKQLPGVESVATVFPIPFTPQIDEVWLAVEGRTPDPKIEQTTFVSVISSGYLKTMKIPILEGRGFEPRDEAPNSRFVLIDQGLAAQYWPGQSPLGRSIKLATQDFSDPKQPSFTVIGVVGSVRASGLDIAPEQRVYILVNQYPVSTMSFVVRTKIEPASLARDIQDKIHSVDANVPVFNVSTMENTIQSSQTSRRLAMLLLISFSAAALILATIGLYGVMSYVVGERINEIGIRMAVGAQTRDIAKLLLGYGAALVAVGIVAGLIASIAFGQLMRTLLFGVKSTDALTFIFSGATIAAIALAACYIPTRRAMRVDPIVALRYE